MVRFLQFLCGLTVFLTLVAVAREAALPVPIQHMDGDFPGRDFFPYLGIGPIYLLFPIFVLAGADLSASTFSAHLGVMLCSWLAIFAIVTMLLRPKTAGSSIFLSAVILVGLLTLGRALLNPFVAELVSHPGASLRMIRATIPYFVGLGIFAVHVGKIGQF